MAESPESDPDFNPPLKSILFNKWTSTVSSIWIQSTSGSLYTFSIYSPSLKTSQHYSQSTLNFISIFKDFGANSGILSGLLYSKVEDFTGPWVVIFTGAVLCFLGYFLMWLSVVGVLDTPPVFVMCGFMLLAAHSSTFFNTANVVTGVNNFPNHRGTIVGIMKGFLGLSGAILIQVYQILFKDKPTAFLLMLALLPTANSLIFMFFVQIFRRTEMEEKKHLNGFSLFAVVIAIYLMAIIVIQNLLSLRLTVRVVSFVALIILLLSIVSVVFKSERAKTYRKVRLLLERDELTSEPELDTHSMYIGRNSNGYQAVPSGAEERTDRSEELNILQHGSLNLLQAMCTCNFWFLIITTGCGMGSGLATVNNMSQIGESLGYSSLETSTLVSLWSIWNFFGRFGAGYVSDYFIHNKGWSRPLFIAITLAGMSLGYVIMASGISGALYIGSVLVGVCYGAQWSLMPTIASELFGKLHFGTIFNTITIANPVGSYIFSVKVIGYIYDKGASEEGNMCTGTYCFMLSFYVMAGATFLGFLVALVLFYRTRSFYTHVVVRTLSMNRRAVADFRG